MLVHLQRFWQIDLLLPGAILPMVVTAPQFKTSWGEYKRLRLQGPLSLQFWQIGQLLPGATHSLVGTVQKSKISSGMCSRFGAHVKHLLRFWKMDLLFLGAILPLVVSALQFKISWAFCSTGVRWMQICIFFVLNDLIYSIHRSCDFWKVQLSQVHLGDLQVLKFCGGHNFIDVD